MVRKSLFYSSNEGCYKPAVTRNAMTFICIHIHCVNMGLPPIPGFAGTNTVPYSPAAARSAWDLSVRSHENSGSSRPKWPYAAVFE